MTLPEPRTIRLLVCKESMDQWREELLPIVAAQLVHCLAAIERSVVIAIIEIRLTERFLHVVLVKTVLQDEVACLLGLRRIVHSCVC